MKIIKCDFCECSINKNGKLKCPYDSCLKSKEDIYEMLKKLKDGE